MDRHILIDTLKQYPFALAEYPEAQDDKELVQIAVKKNGSALQFASKRLRNDFETVMIAVRKTGWSLEFASEALQDNLEIVMAAVKSDGSAYQFASEKLHNNSKVVIEATRTDSNIIDEIPEELLSNYEIAKNLIKLDPLTIRYFDEDMLVANVDLLKIAIKGSSDACMYLPESIWSHKDILMNILEVDAYVIRYALENDSKIDKDLALAAMKGVNSSWGFRELPIELQSDSDVLRAYVSNLDIEAREGFLWNINISPELLQDDLFVANIVDYCSECEECPYDEPECIWNNEAFRERALEVCGCCLDTGCGFVDWTEDDDE